MVPEGKAGYRDPVVSESDVNRWYHMLGLGRHLAVSPEGALQAPEKFGVGKLERRERRAALELRPKKTEQNRSGSVGWETTRNQGLPQRPTVGAEVRLCLGGDFRALSLDGD